MHAFARSPAAAPPRLGCGERPRRTSRRGVPLRAVAEAANGAAVAPLSLPTSTAAQMAQARGAVQAACDAGVTRQRLLITLPLIGATDLDDWPGGTRQMWTAAKPLVTSLLEDLSRPANVAVTRRVIDDADAVVELSTARHTAVVFPTGETLSELRKLDAAKGGNLLMIVNSCWNTEGSNLISDLGFGPWKKANEEFIARFEETYTLTDYRIRGATLRVLRAFPRPFQVFAVDARGGSECIASQATRPTYADLERMLAALGDRSIANADWATRLRSEIAFNIDSAKPPPPQE